MFSITSLLVRLRNGMPDYRQAISYQIMPIAHTINYNKIPLWWAVGSGQGWWAVADDIFPKLANFAILATAHPTILLVPRSPHLPISPSPHLPISPSPHVTKREKKPIRHLQKLTSNPCTAWVKTEFLEMSIDTATANSIS
ncbi:MULTISPECIES: hypothetical protein [Moorena]|nr:MULTISPECIES: hypothetical protein [Moorena]NEP35968.1 hypothetical protein [Moorena sp. SIO3B2]NER92207.1 hypothetical protein [Moorena sp. SIO3A2]NES43774.1 hypothetical protein [Moorena sp. SIO2C4]